MDNFGFSRVRLMERPDWVRVHSWAPHLCHEPMTNYWIKVVQRGKTRKN